MPNPIHPASTTTREADRFDPARFRIEVPIADPLIEVIPVNEVIRKRDRTAGRFSIVPLAAAPYFPPTARVLLLLAHVAYVQAPDLEGGWYRLATGLSSDFHLLDKDARRYALATLEKAGIIEVRREHGKSPYIRLSPDRRAEFQHVPGCIPPSTWCREDAHSRGLSEYWWPRPPPRSGLRPTMPFRILPSNGVRPRMSYLKKFASSITDASLKWQPYFSNSSAARRYRSPMTRAGAWRTGPRRRLQRRPALHPRPAYPLVTTRDRYHQVVSFYMTNRMDLDGADAGPTSEADRDNAALRDRSWFGAELIECFLQLDGKVVHMMQRSDIEHREAVDIAAELKKAFDKFCAKPAPVA